MATFSIWTHPATNQTRVYINGLVGQGHGSKVWIEKKEKDQFGFDYDIKARVAAGSYTKPSTLEDAAEKAIFEKNCGKPVFSFDDVLKLDL